jgi:zinc D-Ala-D-Ala dipeptidase
MLKIPQLVRVQDVFFKKFYPFCVEFYSLVTKVDKENLFRDGYIASRSGHSRGSTVDLTLINLADKKDLDMGSGFDWFGPESWPDNPSASPSQQALRLLLQTLMKKQGFKPYPQEWWHFTLENEPYPETYFDFPVG